MEFIDDIASSKEISWDIIQSVRREVVPAIHSEGGQGLNIMSTNENMHQTRGTWEEMFGEGYEERNKEMIDDTYRRMFGESFEETCSRMQDEINEFLEEMEVARQISKSRHPASKKHNQDPHADLFSGGGFRNGWLGRYDKRSEQYFRSNGARGRTESLGCRYELSVYNQIQNFFRQRNKFNCISIKECRIP